MHFRPFIILAVILGSSPPQVKADEEDLYYKLANAWQNLRQSRLLLEEGYTNLANPDFNLTLIAIRFEQVQRSLTKTRATVDQVHKGWKEILDGMIDKRRRPRIIEEYSEWIFKPLERIKDPNAGDLVQAERAMHELIQLLNKNQKPDAVACKIAKQKYDRLLDNIEKVLNATEPAIICPMLIEILIRIEKEQRVITSRLEWYFRQRTGGPFRGLIDESK